MASVSSTHCRKTSDELVVRRIYKACFPGEKSYELKDNRNQWWVLRVRGEEVGFCGARRASLNPRVCFFSLAGIIPSWRGHRLQVELIRIRLKWARRNGFNRAITYTSTDNIPSARNLIRCGFTLFEPNFEWVQGPVWYFEKRL